MRFSYDRPSWCTGEIPRDVSVRDGEICRGLTVNNVDDGAEKIDLLNVKLLEFKTPARNDRAGHAMFDHWLYSPYTGEKLPQPK